MVTTNRSIQLGRLEELKRKDRQYRIEVDTQVKAFFVHVEPVDDDLQYVSNINRERVESYMKTILRVRLLQENTEREIKRLEKELGLDD